jgi:hypothetical protein
MDDLGRTLQRATLLAERLRLAALCDNCDEAAWCRHELQQLLDGLAGRRPASRGDEEWDLAFAIASRCLGDDLALVLARAGERAPHLVLIANTLASAFALMCNPRAPGEGEPPEDFASNLAHTLQLRYYHVEMALLRPDSLTPGSLASIARSMEVIRRAREWFGRKGRRGTGPDAAANL